MNQRPWYLSLIVSVLGVGCSPWSASKSKDANECKDTVRHMAKFVPLDRNLDEPPGVTINSCIDLQKYYHADQIFARKCRSRNKESLPGIAQTSAKSIPQADSVATMGSSSNILGNSREEGIEEADFTKISEHHIFVISERKIMVLDRATKSYLGNIEIEVHPLKMGLSSPVEPASNISDGELLTVDDKLFVLRDQTIAVYHLTQGRLPEFKEKMGLLGMIGTARISGNRLLLVSYLAVPLAGSPGASDWMQGRDCRGVYMGRGPSHNTMTIVSSHDVDNLSAKEEFIFASRLELYLTKNYVTLYENTGLFTDVRRIKIEDDGSLGRVKSASLEGAVKDVWALSELGAKGDYLSVATTTNHQVASAGTPVSSSIFDLNSGLTNHLSILSDLHGPLKTVGAVKNFGQGEDIRSARKVGDLIYIVTFKKTDPLFAIDVSNPEDPKILSELKIPGFSTYMHPLSSTQLVGLGFDAEDKGSYALYQGIQVSLFDTLDPRNVTRSHVKILGSRGSSSLATVDHRAFFMDQEAALFGFPMTEINSEFSQSREKKESDFFTGAILYRAIGNTLVEAKRISHREFISAGSLMNLGSLYAWWQDPARNLDIERLFKIDGSLLTVSRSGVKNFDYSKLTELSSVSWGKGMVRQSMSRGMAE